MNNCKKCSTCKYCDVMKEPGVWVCRFGMDKDGRECHKYEADPGPDFSVDIEGWASSDSVWNAMASVMGYGAPKKSNKKRR